MKKNGFIEQQIIGTDYPQSLPTNRKQQFFYILRDNYGLIIALSMLTFIFAVPIIFVHFALSYKINSVSNIAEENNIILKIIINYGLWMVIGFVLLGIGISGLMFVIRKMIWEESFHIKDFFIGIKRNYKRFKMIFLLLGISYFIMISDLACYGYNFNIRPIYKYCLCFIGIIQFCFIFLMTMFMISQEVRYVISFKSLISNSFEFTTKLLFKNILIGLIIAIPWILILIVPGIFQLLIMSIMFFIYFGISGLIISEYTAVIFDKYVNKGIYPELYHKGLKE